MQWNEFLDTAGRLAQGATEGDWRSAISRAYYAVFHSFREFFASQGLHLGRGGQSHFNLYVGLLNCGVPQVTRFGTRVDDLREQRTEADYDLAQILTQSLAMNAVGEARKVVRDFQSVLTGISAVQIVAGAKKYLQTIGRVGTTPSP